MTSSATWKVGRLAEASGLTVRTLHHWDTIGLLSPSQRTTGGHREYTEDDLVRLYQVLALRSLAGAGYHRRLSRCWCRSDTAGP
ncbi:MerR family transcriptional regulator [Streptomyces sp. NPDC002888]|uniref:MerR family transcriptional regulator n=1 Tax=Streptomyces sp. NPDC002888 TaxID=3364668 RepID=UPI0036C55E75